MPDHALIVVDMLNTYDHPDGERCAANAQGVVPRLQRVIGHARDADDVELVYVNDHYGQWTSDRERLISHVCDAIPDRALVDGLLPEDDDPLLLKARHSIFFNTPLEYLLRQRGITTVTLVGQVTEQCILYSALDAYVRHFDVRIAQDCVIAIDDELADAALRMMRRNMRAELIDVGG